MTDIKKICIDMTLGDDADSLCDDDWDEGVYNLMHFIKLFINNYGIEVYMNGHLVE